MKKFILGLIVGICIAVPASLYAENVQQITAYINPDVKITVNGEPLVLEEPAILYNQRTYLPLRWVAENVMGMAVGWDQETQTVVLTPKIDESQIWPTNDVSTFEKTGGEKVKTKDDVNFGTEYPKLFIEDDEASLEDVKKKVKSIEYYINLFNKRLSEYDPATASETDTIFAERYQEELPKLQSALTYWQGLKEQKEEQLKQERENSRGE